jgi:hypothetical protein
MRDAFRHALFAFIILSDLQQRHNETVEKPYFETERGDGD